jgi:hypothetical protein
VRAFFGTEYQRQNLLVDLDQVLKSSSRQLCHANAWRKDTTLDAQFIRDSGLD